MQVGSFEQELMLLNAACLTSSPDRLSLALHSYSLAAEHPGHDGLRLRWWGATIDRHAALCEGHSPLPKADTAAGFSVLLWRLSPQDSRGAGYSSPAKELQGQGVQAASSSRHICVALE